MSRSERIRTRTRPARWSRPPVMIDRSICVNCDLCLRACPPAFGAVLHRTFAVVVVPELCSGCGECVTACPVLCIDDDPGWAPSPDTWWEELKVEVHA